GGEGVAGVQVFLQAAAHELHRRLELRALGGPETLHADQIRADQAGDALEAREQVAPKLDRALARQAGPEDHGQQLRVAQAARAARKQALARPFRSWPV